MLLEFVEIRTVVQTLWVPSLVTAAIFTLVALVSIWAALSRRHWFTRAVVVAVVLSATLAIRGHDVALVFLMQSLTTVAGITALKGLRTRSLQAHAMKNTEHEAALDSTGPAVSEDAATPSPWSSKVVMTQAPAGASPEFEPAPSAIAPKSVVAPPASPETVVPPAGESPEASAR